MLLRTSYYGVMKKLMSTNNLSKLVSYALRHRPEEFNLTPDSQGWVDLDDLVRGIKNYSADYSNVTIEDLHQMVETAHKKRHQIQGQKIRAFYGHSAESIKMIERAPRTPPVTLYHGTSKANWECIRQEGLKPMSRQSVHLTENKADAIAVGRRHSSEVVLLKIDAAAAIQAGVSFFPSSSKVWLVDSVPACFVSLAL